MSDKFTLPLANRRATFTAMLTRLVSEINYISSLTHDASKHKDALIFQVSSTFYSPYNETADPNYNWTALSAHITTIIHGEEIPVFRVCERQKDGWRDHMEDWISVFADTSDCDRFVRRAYSRHVAEPLKKLLGSRMSGLAGIELGFDVERIGDRLDNSRSIDVSRAQTLLNTAMSNAPLHLKTSYSSDVWRKHIQGIFRPEGMAHSVRNIYADIIIQAREEWVGTYTVALDYAMETRRWLQANQPTYGIFVHQSIPYWTGSDSRVNNSTAPRIFIEIARPANTSTQISKHNSTAVMGILTEYRDGRMKQKPFIATLPGLMGTGDLTSTLEIFAGKDTK